MNKLPEIIGLAGTNGAGKDTLGDLRFDRNGARKVSLSDILRTEATKRGLSHERSNLGAIGDEWGRKLGAGALSIMTIQDFLETRTHSETGLSAVSIRRVEEGRAIQAAGGTLLWIDADRMVRYRRILNANRGRVTDFKTFEEFCAEEDKEMHPKSDDPFEMDMAGVRDMADIHLLNEFGEKEEFEADLIKRFGL
jgi:cytidylate kinase